MAKKKLNNTIRIDGKKDRPIPQTLDQVWGDTGISKYNTLDIETYASKINGFTRTDLQNECLRVGIGYNDNIPLIRKRLIAEFKSHVNLYKVVPDQLASDVKITPEIQKILDEGR